MSSTRILLADDHKIMCEGLRSLLDEQPDMEVVAETENGRMAVQMAVELLPDVVIMDIAMPDLNGIEATRRIVDEAPNVKVVALSMHSDKRLVVEMLRVGASGYVLKDCVFGELADAIRAVVAHQGYLSPGIAGIVVEDYVHRLSSTDASVRSILTRRECEVLQLLSEGRTTKQIASRLHVSVKTVETHRRQMMNKLDIYSIAELTKYALREGLTYLET